MRRSILVVSIIATLSISGCLRAKLNTDEYAKLSTVAVFTDAAVRKSGSVINVQENAATAAAAADYTKAILAQKGLTLNPEESVVTVCGFIGNEDHVLVQMGNETAGHGDKEAAPPYFSSSPSFQEKRTKLMSFYTNLSRPTGTSTLTPADEMGSSTPKEPEQKGPVLIPTVNDLSLRSDAVLVIRMGGAIYEREQVQNAMVKDLAISLLASVLAGQSMVANSNVRDSAYISMTLVHAKTGEVLWTDSQTTGQEPTDEKFGWILDGLLSDLPERKLASAPAANAEAAGTRGDALAPQGTSGQVVSPIKN